MEDTVPPTVARVPDVGNVTEVSPVNVPVKECAPENAVLPPMVIVLAPLFIPNTKKIAAFSSYVSLVIIFFLNLWSVFKYNEQ